MKMFKFYSAITADDHNMLLNDTPASRKKVVLYGNAILIPVLLWFLSTLAVSTRLFGTDIWTGILAGLIAAFLIFSIERSILLANGNRWIAGFRIVLGFCIALLGSVVVDDCLFHDDINYRLEKNKKDEIDAARTEVEKKFAPFMAEADSAVRLNWQIWHAQNQEVIREAEGKSPSGLVGVGTITQLKANMAAEQEVEYYKAAGLKDSLQREQKAEEDKAIARVEASYGEAMLLKRIEALFGLVSSNGIVAFIYTIFTLLIWCLEFLVVLLKMNTAETNYESKLNTLEQIGKNRLEKIEAKDASFFDAGASHPKGRVATNAVQKKAPSFYN